MKRRVRARVAGMLVVGVGALLVLGAFADRADAHAVLTSSRPAAGERLGAAPGAVVLEFSEPLNAKLSRATVIDPAHRTFEGRASGGQETRIALSTNAQGVYQVQWTTVSTLDGHAVRGSFRFGVGVSPAGPSESGGGATPSRADLLIAVARWVEALALLVAVGTLTLRWLTARRPDLSWVRPSVRPAAVVALGAGVVVVLSEASSAAGSASPAALWSYLSAGLPGLARLSRVGLEALALAAAASDGPTLRLSVFGAVAALAASGHGAAIRPPWWGIAVDAGHLTAAGVWAGGILALATIRPPEGWRSPRARELLVRFSPPALVAFALTVGFGVIQAQQELGTLGALTGSAYGGVLLAKIVLVALMVPLSAVAWRLRRPHVRLEAALAVLVVAAAAVLAAFPVPPSRLVEEEAAKAATPPAQALPGPTDLTMGDHAGQVLVGLTLDPGEPGDNRVLVYLLPVEGNRAASSLEAELVTAVGRMPLERCGDTCRQARLAVRGGEQIEVHVDGPTGGTATFGLPTLPAPDGGALLARAQAAMHAVRSYRLDETLSWGRAPTRSEYAFVAPDRMHSVVAGTSETIWIGTTRYTKDAPGAGWRVETGAPPIPVPSFTWDYFEPFRAVRILGTEAVEGTRTTIVSFFGQSGSTPVWFRLWVDDAGLVRQAQMRAQGHFMDHRYHAFGEPISIEPPAR